MCLPTVTGNGTDPRHIDDLRTGRSHVSLVIVGRLDAETPCPLSAWAVQPSPRTDLEGFGEV